MIKAMPNFPPENPSSRKARVLPPPLDAARLEALALAYVARFATSAARLETYLLRKLRGRGWAPGRQQEWLDEDLPGDADMDHGDVAVAEAELRSTVAALVARFVAAGYIDDQAFASTRSSGLQRRGYGRRHISQALGQAGIAADVAMAVLPGEAAGRRAALALARKRRLGPFGAGPLERAARAKQIAILLRAGHRLDSARELVNAVSIAAAEGWAHADDEESE